MKLTIVFFLTLATLSAEGQNNYRSGFILPPSGDTLRGFVLHKGSISMAEKCSFKKNKGDEARIYTPNDILGFGFDHDQFYTSRQFTEDNLPAQHFAEELVRGKLSLLKLIDAYFLADSDNILYPLFSTKKRVEVNGSDYEVTLKNYLGVLRKEMVDCPAVVDKIDNTDLDEKSLTQLLERYNACTSTRSVSFKQNRPWIKLYLGLELGFVAAKLHGFDQSYDYIERHQFSKSNSIYFGGFATFFSPRTSENASFSLGLQFQSNNFSSVLKTYPTYSVSSHLKYSIIKVPVSFSYNLVRTDRKFVPFGEAGLSFNFIRPQEHDVTVSFPSGLSSIYYDPFDSKKFVPMLFVSVGSYYNLNKKLSLFSRIRYEFGSSILNQDRDYSIIQQNYSIAAGIVSKF